MRWKFWPLQEFVAVRLPILFCVLNKLFGCCSMRSCRLETTEAQQSAWTMSFTCLRTDLRQCAITTLKHAVWLAHAWLNCGSGAGA